MNELIKALRAECGFEVTTGSYYSERSAEEKSAKELLEWLQYGDGKTVHTEFANGGRWSNYETTIYELTADDGEKVYFKFSKRSRLPKCKKAAILG